MEIRKPKTFDDFQKYSQLLLASRIFHEYLEIRNTLVGIRRMEVDAQGDEKPSGFPSMGVEPEQYVVSWIKENITGGTELWREGVSDYFIKLSTNYYNALRNSRETNE